MQCPGCGTENPVGATFCMRCGNPVSALATSADAQAVHPEVLRQKKTLWIYAVMTLLLGVIMALLLMLNSRNTLQVGSAIPHPVLQAAATVPAQTKMPQDVYDWLGHLQKIEVKKNELSVKQAADMKTFELMLNTLGPGIGEMEPTNEEAPVDEPSSVTKGKFENLRPQWKDLLSEFESVPPPEECKPIANDYDIALTEIPGMISDLEDLLNQVSTNPQAALIKAQTMQSKSYKNIDQNFAQTDVRVQAICDKYGVKKWFNIGDKGGVFAKPGF